MNPVRQTKFSLFYADGRRYNYGNCLVACIASWLDLSVDEVPNIYTFYGLDPKGTKIYDQKWVGIINQWLNLKFSKKLVFHPDRKSLNDGYVIVRGKSFRDKPHSCIYLKKDGVLQEFFDPHPTDQFLKEMDYFITIETI